MKNDDQVDASGFSESIQELRDEMRRDIRGLATTVARRPEPKPGVSPLALVASVFGSLFVGAAGMSVYDSQTGTDADAPPVDVRADLQAAMLPYTQQLEKVAQSLVVAQQAETEDSKSHGLLFDDLAETVTSLQKSADVQSATFHDRIDLLADELAAKITHAASSDSKPTVAVREPVFGVESSAVQPASAEADVTDAEDDLVDVDKTPAAPESDVTDTKDDLVEVNKTPAAPEADAPERGELVIDNPSEYDLNLLINGEPLEIKARGVTTVDVTVGTVKTQIASLPKLAQTWDKWEAVDGVKRLTIKVESGNGLYRLR